MENVTQTSHYFMCVSYILCRFLFIAPAIIYYIIYVLSFHHFRIQNTIKMHEGKSCWVSSEKKKKNHGKMKFYAVDKTLIFSFYRTCIYALVARFYGRY